LYFLHYLSVCNVIPSGFFSNVCDIYVCYMLNKITYLLTYLGTWQRDRRTDGQTDKQTTVITA